MKEELVPPIPKRTTVGDRRVLNSKRPKRLASFGSSTGFLRRRRLVGMVICFDKKIMSYFYAKKSDETECAHRVFLHTCVCASRVSTYMRGVWYRDLDIEEHVLRKCQRLYESLLTCAAYFWIS